MKYLLMCAKVVVIASVLALGFTKNYEDLQMMYFAAVILACVRYLDGGNE